MTLSHGISISKTGSEVIEDIVIKVRINNKRSDVFSAMEIVIGMGMYKFIELDTLLYILLME